MDYSYSKTNDGARDIEEGFRSIDTLSKALIGLLILGIVMLAAFEVTAFMQINLLSRAFTKAEALANDLRIGFVVAGMMLELVLTVIIFSIWIVRAHRNLPALGAQRLDVTPGWALGAFFIPVVNLWKPFTAMRTLWKASHNGPGWEYEDVPWWVAVWWVGWILIGVVERVMDRLSKSSSAIDQLIATTRGSMYVEAGAIIVHALAVLLVYRIWQAQNEQLAAREAAATSPPPPSLRDALPQRS